MKNEFKSAIVRARCVSTPTLAKKRVVIVSLKPSPPMEIGNIVMAPTIGRNIKKYSSLILRPKAEAMTKKLSGAAACTKIEMMTLMKIILLCLLK